MENILMLKEHSLHPRHFCEDANANIVHSGRNPMCGDALTIYARVEDGVVVRLSFTGVGCAVCLASMSRLTEIIPGCRVNDVRGWGVANIEDILGMTITPLRVPCAVLGLRILQEKIGG
jgi:nitrogen fixation NifU-like protein